MTRHEKLILFLVALVLLERFGGFAGDVYIARTYGAYIPSEVTNNWESLSVLLSFLVNIGAAIWLYIEGKAVALRAWVWSLLGLFFGLMGVILFYVIQVFAAKRANET